DLFSTIANGVQLDAKVYLAPPRRSIGRRENLSPARDRDKPALSPAHACERSSARNMLNVPGNSIDGGDRRSRFADGHQPAVGRGDLAQRFTGDGRNLSPGSANFGFQHHPPSPTAMN